MESDGLGRTRLEYTIPARGLIGFQGEFLTMTKGTGIMSHVFEEYLPVKTEIPGRRRNGRGCCLISRQRQNVRERYIEAVIGILCFMEPITRQRRSSGTVCSSRQIR